MITDPSDQALQAVTRSIFFDLLLVLNSLDSPILVDHTGSLHHALDLIADHQEGTGNQPNGKMIKATQALESPGLRVIAVDVDAVIKVIKGDLAAVDRLRASRGLTSS